MNPTTPFHAEIEFRQQRIRRGAARPRRSRPAFLRRPSDTRHVAR